MQSKLDLIGKLDNELIKYMKLQGKSEWKLMLDAPFKISDKCRRR